MKSLKTGSLLLIAVYFLQFILSFYLNIADSPNKKIKFPYKAEGLIKEAAAAHLLEDRRDLPVTTDFRAVFSEVANRHLNIHDDPILFPEWSGTAIGVMKT